MKKILIKKLMSRLPGLASLLACFILASCSGATNFSNGDRQKRNEVKMVKIPFMITFEAGNSRLSDASIRRLDNFMMKTNVSYGDELSMDFSLKRDGSLSPENQKRLVFLSTLLKKRGLHLSPDITPYGMSPATNQARLLISRYIVTPPLCGDWSQPSTGNYGNMNLPDLGCSSQANLGLMIANPRDLITGVQGSAPDAEKAAQSIKSYRTGKTGKKSSGKAKKK